VGCHCRYHPSSRYHSYDISDIPWQGMTQTLALTQTLAGCELWVFALMALTLVS